MPLEEFRGWVPLGKSVGITNSYDPGHRKVTCDGCGHLFDWTNMNKDGDEPAWSLVPYRPQDVEEIPAYRFKESILCGKCFVEWFDQNKDWLTMLELMEGDR